MINNAAYNQTIDYNIYKTYMFESQHYTDLDMLMSNIAMESMVSSFHLPSLVQKDQVDSFCRLQNPPAEEIETSDVHK